MQLGCLTLRALLVRLQTIASEIVVARADLLAGCVDLS